MSKFAIKVKGYYERGIWTRSMVQDAVTKGKITALEAAAILGGAQGVLELLGSGATKAELLEACDVLGIEADAGMTKAEIRTLIEAA